MAKNIEIIKVLSDLGAGNKGAGFGALAIQRIIRSQKSAILSNLVTKTSYLPVNNGFDPNYARHIETVVDTCKYVSYEVCKSIICENKPVLISGDHSNAAGTIAGIKMAKPDSVLGVVWIDAHADLHSPYTTPSGNMHGMPIAASIAKDNLECSNRIIDPVTQFYWEKFKNLGNISPKLHPHHLAYVSLRDYEDEEAHLIAKHGIKFFNVCSLLDFGVENVVAKIFDQLKHCTDIYVSFDVDCLDSSISQGTGLPVKGGLMAWEAELLTELLLSNPKVSCFEIAEFNPFLDFNNNTADIVFSILEKGVIAMQKQQITAYNYGEKLTMTHV